MLKNLLNLGFLLVALAGLAACNTSSDPTPVTLVIEEPADPGCVGTPEECGWAMVWEDEFEGAALGAEWTPQIGDGCPNLCGWGNQELEYYRAENATVADGMLTIVAEQEAFGGKNYTSSRLITKNAVEVKYGRIETRMKTPDGAGYWPAFWMLPNEEETPYAQGGNTWAAWGEIDIMESGFDGDTDLVAGTVHYGMSFPGNQFTTEEVDGAEASSGFHTYAIEWEEGEIRWYYDGFHYATQTSDVYWNYYWAGEEIGYASAPFGPFDQDFYLILNLAVGGTFPGPVGQDTVFPGEVVVDYVRVYECSADTVTGKGCASNLNLNAKQPGDRDVFIGSWDLYTDALGPLEWDFESGLVTRDLAVASDGAAVVTEVAAADTSRGMVVDFSVSAGGGSMQIEAADAESFVFSNVALGGEIKFDYFIDGANTDPAVLAGGYRVGLGSGALVSDDLEAEIADQWLSASIRVSDMTSFGSLNIESLFRVEVDSFAHVLFDNIRFVCGAPGGCGIEAPTEVIEVAVLDVYTDAVVTEFWPAGIGAFSTDAPDDGGYNDPSAGYHVSWQEVDTGEAGHDTVLEASWGASDAFGLVFIQSARDVGVDLSAFATGNLIFDMRITDTGDDFTGMTFKVDSVFPSGSADMMLTGVDDTGVWKTYTIPVSSFSGTTSTGGFVAFDITKVNTGLVIWPNFGNQQNVTIQLDNIRWQVGEPADPVEPPGGVGPTVPPAGSEVLFADEVVVPWSGAVCCSGNVVITSPVADGGFGAVYQMDFTGTETLAGIGHPEPNGSVGFDLSSYSGGTLEFDALVVEEGAGPWMLKVEALDGLADFYEVPLSASQEGVAPVVNDWQHYTFNLDDMVNVDLANVQNVFFFPSWPGGNGTIQIDNLHFATAP